MNPTGSRGIMRVWAVDGDDILVAPSEAALAHVDV